MNVSSLVRQFIDAVNSFDVETALALFAKDAAIDDISVGEKFSNTSGVRNYLERYFVKYHTVTKVLSMDLHSDLNADVHVDFTGDFGHETGNLNIFFNANGQIKEIAANLD